jgi:FecR protein
MSDSRKLFLTTVLALVLGAIIPARGLAQEAGSHARIVRISYVQGTVQFNGQAAIMNSPVVEESKLVTGTDGLAEVQFEDSSAIRLASETEITFAQLARLSTGEAMTRVDLDEGEAEFLIPASSAGRFAVNVRGKNILFKQAGRFRILSTNSSPLEIAVWKGEAGVRDLESGQEVSVKDRETFTLNPDDLGQYDLESSVLADDLDRWSEQRDEDLRTNYVANNAPMTVYNQYQSAGGYGLSGLYVPPYVYDFNAFGGCPYYGYAQPFWFGSPGYCWNSGFGFNPWFFSPPVVFIVTPVHPRRPVPIRPPTVPTVARGGPGNVSAKPGFRSFRTQSEGQRLFNDETFRRSTPEGNSQGKVNEATHTPVIAPGQRSGGNAVAPPTHVAPAPPVHRQHSSPPASRPPSTSHASFSGSHGFSGGSRSSGSSAHSSGSSSHSGGHR